MAARSSASTCSCTRAQRTARARQRSAGRRLPALLRSAVRGRARSAVARRARDPRTRELEASYLTPLDIERDARRAGVPARPHRGRGVPRARAASRARWQFWEELVAGTLADFVALVLQAREQLRVEAQLKRAAHARRRDARVAHQRRWCARTPTCSARSMRCSWRPRPSASPRTTCAGCSRLRRCRMLLVRARRPARAAGQREVRERAALPAERLARAARARAVRASLRPDRAVRRRLSAAAAYESREVQLRARDGRAVLGAAVGARAWCSAATTRS